MHDFHSGRQAIETMIRSQDLEGLLRQAETFHGHLCPGVSLGVKAGQYAMNAINRGNTGMEEVIAIVECNNCFADGIQIVTGCTLGNNALIYKDLGKTAVTVARREDGFAVRLIVRQEYREKMFDKYPNARGLFQKVVKERSGTEEEIHRFHHVFDAIAKKELKTPVEEQFNIQQLSIQVPEYAKIHDSVVCSVCGEQLMKPRAEMQQEQPVCLTCAQKEFFVLTGQGMSRTQGL
jgi:formylmethanofuran dehydrogenase subunit E